MPQLDTVIHIGSVTVSKMVMRGLSEGIGVLKDDLHFGTPRP